MKYVALLALVSLAGGCQAVNADASAEGLIREMGLSEVAQTLASTSQADCLVAPVQDTIEWRAQSVLACLGFAGPAETVLQRWQNHPVYGRLRDPGAPLWLQERAADLRDFEALLGAAMVAGLSTGYNIVPQALWPEFDAESTVIYSHSDWQHARQLVALLALHGLTPEVTPLVKQSKFVARQEWGNAERDLPTLSNGQRVIDQLEFELFFRFDSPRQVEKFGELVTQYAKRDSQDEVGLIHGAWWQPFYRTFAPFPQLNRLVVMLVSYRGFRVNLLSLPEQAPERLLKLRALSDEWQITPYDIWVNPAFYRFQMGDYR
ncbi:MAG: hypothetical protein NXH95_05780 [Pseudomonadaceae bacterium]|nr:hypothetical protein [Pseudomonadaceae bacterium]